jgi:hypothetical protein
MCSVKLIRRVGRFAELVEVWSTAFDTLAASKANKRETGVKDAAVLPLGMGVLGGLGGFERCAVSPAGHPVVGRQPTSLTRDKVSKVREARGSAKDDPRCMSNGTCAGVHKKHLVGGISEEGCPTGKPQGVESEITGELRWELVRQLDGAQVAWQELGGARRWEP